MTPKMPFFPLKTREKSFFSALFQKNVQKYLQVIKLMPIFAPKNVCLCCKVLAHDARETRNIYIIFIN